MSWNEPDHEDSRDVVDIEPGGESTVRKTAAAFAEEFAELGYTPGEILGLFRNPFYAAVHQIWRVLGDEEIARIVHESASRGVDLSP